MKKIIALTFWIYITLSMYAQNAGQPPPVAAVAVKGMLTGKIVEAGSNVPLEYANVAIYSMMDSSLAGGAIANADGIFEVNNLKPGEYYLDAKFIGYEHTKKSNISISSKRNTIDLGTLLLNPAAENLDEVNVYAQDVPIVYDIDKKIIDPSHFPTSANGTATDVLANTPSVVVDVEGNVTLRGSSSFTVLIDGRPTPFSSEDALDQIPASTIRNIEIITNPSAKYDPDGNAGIININTKKSKLTGVSGIVNASYDSNGSINGDFLFNYKLDKFNVFLSGNKSNRYGSGEAVRQNETYGLDTIYTLSSGLNERGSDSWSVKTGFDYFMNDFNTLSFNVSLNGRERESGGINDFHEYSTSGYDLKTITESSSLRGGKNIALGLDYKKTFKTEGQELTAYAYYETGNSQEYSFYDQFNAVSDRLIMGQSNWEDGSGDEMRLKLDYVHPFSNKMKLEAGYQTRIDNELEWNDVHWYTSSDDYEPSPESEYYTETLFRRDIHSAYSTFSNSGEVFGYRLGMRSEYTDRNINWENIDYGINRWDFFPSAHFSFNLPLELQMTASYSRRIQRPRGYYLEPFKTYTDAYNVRQGNPSIEPEYIDSYEIGYQKQLENGFMSGELYHRNTNNKIEWLRSVYEDNVMLTTMDNIGEDFSTGVELMWNNKPTKWWTYNLMGNLYHYNVRGELYGSDVSQSSVNWRTRLGNTFTLTKTTKLQVDGMYNSPSTSAQGRREGFAYTNLAVRQDLLENKLNVTFSIRDVLNTAKWGYESSGPDFYSKMNFDMKSPVFSITLSYKVNNYRAKRNGNGYGNEGGGDMGEGEGGGGF